MQQEEQTRSPGNFALTSAVGEESQAIEVTGVDDGQKHACSNNENNSFELNLQTAGLALQMQTRISATAELVETATRLQFALEQLRDAHDRLALAFERIGFLEAKLTEQEKVITQLRAQSSSPP